MIENIYTKKVLLIGQPKSGTTALFFAVKEAMASGVRALFEPKEFISEVNDANTGVLAKILTGMKIEYTSFLSFDKKILITRDPRDRIISDLLYLPYERYYQDLKGLERFIHLLKLKERDPLSVSVRELWETYIPSELLETRFQLWNQKFFEAEKTFEPVLIMKYEDFVDGNVRALEDYLGLKINTKIQVDPGFQRVVRSKSYRAWKDWFTEDDRAFFGPLFSEYMKHYGYSENWCVNKVPKIDKNQSSEYVLRIVNERRCSRDSVVGKPLFLIGSARSGTTLLQRILNSFDGVCIWGEHGGFFQSMAESFNAFKKDAVVRQLKSLATENKENLKFYGFKEIRYGYKGTEVSPRSTSDDGVLDFLKDVFPESKFIFIVRHPFDVITSTLSFLSKKAFDFAEDDFKDSFKLHMLRENGLQDGWDQGALDVLRKKCEQGESVTREEYAEAFNKALPAPMRFKDYQRIQNNSSSRIVLDGETQFLLAKALGFNNKMTTIERCCLNRKLLESYCQGQIEKIPKNIKSVVDEAAYSWAERNANLFKFYSENKEACFFLKFEDLIDVNKTTLADLSSFLGLQLGPEQFSVLDFEPGREADPERRIRGNLFTKEHISRTMEITRQTAEKFGYHLCEMAARN